MNVVAIVPAKDAARAKERLTPLLHADEREALHREMLTRVVAALKRARGIHAIIVATSDADLLASCAAAGLIACPDGGADMNGALTMATHMAATRGAEAVLVVPADVPLVTAEDIEAMVALGRDLPSVVVAPCRRDEGTNALWVRPPGAIPYRFGPGSFAAHRAAAIARGIACTVYRSPRVARDVDTPEDVRAYRAALAAEPVPAPARGARATQPMQVLPITTIGLVEPGADLGRIIADAFRAQGLGLADGDIVVVAQKIVSKAEGHVARLRGIVPSAEAQRLAAITGKEPALVEAILRESTRVLRVAFGHLIVEHRSGMVLANAGIDRSNASFTDDVVTVLPPDPDGSARRLRDALAEATGRRVAVLVIDTVGRPFREGAIGTAIGAAGILPLKDNRGAKDLYGYTLRNSIEAVADEVASAASLLMGQSDEGIPVVVIRGLTYDDGEGGAALLIRSRHEDLFRA